METRYAHKKGIQEAVYHGLSSAHTARCTVCRQSVERSEIGKLPFVASIARRHCSAESLDVQCGMRTNSIVCKWLGRTHFLLVNAVRMPYTIITMRAFFGVLWFVDARSVLSFDDEVFLLHTRGVQIVLTTNHNIYREHVHLFGESHSVLLVHFLSCLWLWFVCVSVFSSSRYYFVFITFSLSPARNARRTLRSNFVPHGIHYISNSRRMAAGKQNYRRIVRIRALDGSVRHSRCGIWNISISPNFALSDWKFALFMFCTRTGFMCHAHDRGLVNVHISA